MAGPYGLSQRLDLRQTQALVMTPQLQQAIKLLQLSNMELASFVEGELEQNPLLERDETPVLPDPTLREVVAEAAADPLEAPPPRDAADYASSETLPSDNDSPLDASFESGVTAEDGSDIGAVESGLASWNGTGGRSDFGDDEFGLEQTLAERVSLREHVLAQIKLDIQAPAERMIAAHLTDMLDEAGYLSGDASAVAELLGCAVERVEAVLARLQQFDPTGIFARNLKECLGIQLKERNRYDPAMAALLDHLPMLASRDFDGLRKVCGVDSADMLEMIAEIRALNPKPGMDFDSEPAQAITPDILMRQQGAAWLVELNTDTLPRVLVNSRYYTRVAKGGLKREDKEYLSERLQSANWLVKSLHQRANTILRVASELVRQQEEFFLHGVERLRPLILRDIAEAIGMHESTVSRVTTNKYMSTPRGIYELKYFFTSAIASSSGGSAHSAEAVRHRIKTLINAESADDVLSDDRIVEILMKDGIDIARRTVAKYREAMGISSSVQRRREKTARF